MHYSIEYRDKALLEMRDAYVWYENELIGLGKDFRKEVNIKIEKIFKQPLPL